MFMNILISFMKIAFLAVLLVIAFALAFYMLLFEPDKMVSGTNCVVSVPAPSNLRADCFGYCVRGILKAIFVLDKRSGNGTIIVRT